MQKPIQCHIFSIYGQIQILEYFIDPTPTLIYFFSKMAPQKSPNLLQYLCVTGPRNFGQTTEILWSALSYHELESALDYRGTLVSLCTEQVYRGQFPDELYSNTTGLSKVCVVQVLKIFVQLGHGQNNVHECVSVHKWESGDECELVLNNA